MRPLDLIGAIELAYDRTKHEEAWLQDLTRVVAPAFSSEGTLTSYFFEMVDGERAPQEIVSVGSSAYGREHYQKAHEVRSREVGSTRAAYECDPYTLLSRAVGAELAKKALRSSGIEADDALGLRANMTPERGVLFTAPVRRGHRIKNHHLWTRFAAHLGAALRLRRSQAVEAPEAAFAVLNPLGRLEHASERAVDAREELASAARDMDRARGKLRRLDPDAASALWRAMVAGEWTLVDWLDSDGKRFLVAQENPIPIPVVAGRNALTERERQVVACAAMGHSNKLIAYDLGLSPSTVSVTLSQAAKKLGVSGKVALIRAFRETQP